MTEHDHHLQHSTTKSLTTMLLARAIAAGRMDPAAPFADYVSDLRGTAAWRDVTLQHVLDMCPGLDYVEQYDDRNSAYYAYARAVGYYPAPEHESIGARRWFVENLTRRAHPPGEWFNYASPLTNGLMMALEQACGESILLLVERELFRRIGAESVAWLNTDRFGFPIAQGQLSLTLRDFARWASVMVNDGCNGRGERVVPHAFIADLCSENRAAHRAFTAGDRVVRFPRGYYRNQFWVIDPRAAQFAMLGIHGQFAWFDLQKELMIVAHGSFPVATSPLLTAAQQALWRGIGDAFS